MYLYIFSKNEVVDYYEKVVSPFPGTLDALKGLKDNSIPVSIISNSMVSADVKHLIELFGWKKYITNQYIFNGSKDKHVKL